MNEKKCICCRKTFIVKRKDKIFCSRKCKKNLARAPYKKYRKEHCEKCGFIPKDMCQLDIDHIDGNHKNNEISNLKTLCANCHRLKTMIERKNHDV
jgi:hypothetical protein